MTDLKKLTKLLDGFGIIYTQTQIKEEEQKSITIEEGSCPKVTGYPGFCTEFTFDKDGKFIDVGAYE